MKAIIIAAGIGRRLLPFTSETPKNILDLGDGTTVLDHQLTTLSELGINDVVLIVGHCAERVKERIIPYSRSMHIETIFNPEFSKTENLVSVWSAREHLKDSLLLINGDTLFESSVVSALLEESGDIALAVGQKPMYDEDDMKVSIENEIIVHIGKNIPLSRVSGESLGIIRFSRRGAEEYRSALEQVERIPSYRQSYYLRAIQFMIDRGATVTFASCPAHSCCELDTLKDLARMSAFLKKSECAQRSSGLTSSSRQ